jgi:hypothetical protein
MAFSFLELQPKWVSGSGGGVGYRVSGIGYRHDLLRGTYVQAEIMQMDYRTVVSAAGLVLKPCRTNVTVAIGVKF